MPCRRALSSTDLDRTELLDCVYRFLNPRRSVSEPEPAVAARAEPELGQEVVADASWLASQSPREQLVFGDLLLDFAQYALDGHFHRVVTLKTLPEVTYAGQLANFLRLPFHYDLLLSLDVPPQAAEMSKLQQKRRMAHSMAATHGGRASDLESESKLSSTEELIRELLGTGQRIPKLTRALLEKSLIELYEAKRESGGIPTLSDLAKRLASSEEESLRTIAKMLYLWTGDRPYGRLLDGQGGLRADAEICTFDLQGLSSYPDLQGVMILILTDFILGRIANEKERKARIIIDEGRAPTCLPRRVDNHRPGEEDGARHGRSDHRDPGPQGRRRPQTRPRLRDRSPNQGEP